MTTPTPASPEALDQITIDLVFALRDSLTDAGPSRLDFWTGGRAASAIETAAAGATSWGQAVTIAARKLQIETLTGPAATSVTSHQALVDADYEAWAGHVARNIVYIVALAYVARPTTKSTKSKTAAPDSLIPATEKAPY